MSYSHYRSDLCHLKHSFHVSDYCQMSLQLEEYMKVVFTRQKERVNKTQMYHQIDYF